MPSSHTSDRRREPVYIDDMEAGRARRPPHLGHERTHRHAPDAYERRDRPHRAKTYNQPRYSPSSDERSPSPPRRPHRRQRPQGHRDPYDSYEDYHRPERRLRDEGYFSDNRHNRPRQDPHRKLPRDRRHDRERGDGKRGPSSKDRERKRPETESKEKKWEATAKEMFKEYAVPAIKAEGGKFITKQIGQMFTK